MVALEPTVRSPLISFTYLSVSYPNLAHDIILILPGTKQRLALSDTANNPGNDTRGQRSADQGLALTAQTSGF